MYFILILSARESILFGELCVYSFPSPLRSCLCQKSKDGPISMNSTKVVGLLSLTWPQIT